MAKKAIYLTPDVAERVRRLLAAFERGDLTNVFMPHPRRVHPPGLQRWVSLYNADTSQIPAYAIVELTGVRHTDGERMAFQVRKTASVGQEPFAFAGDLPIDQSKYGLGTFDLPTFAAYDDSDTPTTGEIWGPKDASWELHKDYPGYLIAGGETDGRVSILPDPEGWVVKGKVHTSDITAGSYGTVNVWRGGSDTGIDLDGYLNWMHGSEKVSAGKEVILRWFRDEAKWVIVAAECE